MLLGVLAGLRQQLYRHLKGHVIAFFVAAFESASGTTEAGLFSLNTFGLQFNFTELSRLCALAKEYKCEIRLGHVEPGISGQAGKNTSTQNQLCSATKLSEAAELNLFKTARDNTTER